MIELIRCVAEKNDLPIVRTLFEEYAASLGFGLESQNFSDELQTLPGKYAPPSGTILLATVDGRPAGCVALRPLSVDACEMKRLYVRQEFRASGLGRRLAERIVQEARTLGYRCMRLDTIASAMRPAVALYRSLGFEPIPPYWENPLPGVEYMELKL